MLNIGKQLASGLDGRFVRAGEEGRSRRALTACFRLFLFWSMHVGESYQHLSQYKNIAELVCVY